LECVGWQEEVTVMIERDQLFYTGVLRESFARDATLKIQGNEDDRQNKPTGN
jgi:hypothetical protein